MPFFLIDVRCGGGAGDATYQAQAATSGKAINMVLAALDAVGVERLIHTVHCSVPSPVSAPQAVLEAEAVVVLPVEDVLPRHIVRG